VEQHDQQLIGRLLPVLKQRLDNATRALSDCLEVKDIATHWYLSCFLLYYSDIMGKRNDILPVKNLLKRTFLFQA